jgi:pectate lyase
MFVLIAAVAIIVLAATPMLAQTAYTYSNEGFEQTGIWPTSASTTERSVTASTGTWKFKSAFQKGNYAHSGTYELAINSSGYLITPQLSTGASTLTLYARSTTTTARTLTVQKSTNGSTFTTVTTIATGGSSYKLLTIAINDAATRYIKIIEPTSGGAYFDDLVVTSGGGTTIPVTGVSVSPTSVSVGLGGTAQLTATVSPSNATNKSVTWSSSNTAVATVNSSGLVTGVVAGSATVTVRTADGGFTATSAITVTSTTVPVTGVSVSPTSVSVAAGGTVQLTATVSPSNATNKSVTWSSSNTGVATVNSSGLVTGVVAGSATVTVRTADGGFTATSSITVTSGGGSTVADGYGRNTTGGGNLSPVSVSSASAFSSAATSSSAAVITVTTSMNVGQVRIASNKTIQGANSGVTITGNLLISGVSNVIVRNLNITNPSGVGSADGIEVTEASTNVFITHCTFDNCSDGSLDMKRQSDNITVSWCRFRYTSQTSHDFVNLIGHSDSFTSDRGFLHITMHHNWYDNGCVERMPRVRYGRVHCYNNYYGSSTNSYNVGLGNECQVLLENGYFDSQNMPWKNYSSGSSTQGLIHWNTGNVFVSTSIPTWAPNSSVFTPPYSYTMDAGSSVKSIVMARAGNSGLAKDAAEEGLAQSNAPTSFALNQNYPNPFNPTTMISFTLVENSFVSLKVYDMLGREVAVLQNGLTGAGSHAVSFDASRLASGMYISRLTVQGENNPPFVKTIKMTLMK